MKKISLIIFGLLLALVIGVSLYFVFILISNRIYGLYLESKYPLAFKETIVKYSSEYQLDPSLVSAVIYEESRFRTNSISDKGAVGLMQLLPETATYIAKKTKDDSFGKESLASVEQNVKYGCYYLAYLQGKYGDPDKTLAAYNAGEGNVDKWIAEGDYKVRFEETRNFVERVKSTQGFYQKLYFNDKSR